MATGVVISNEKSLLETLNLILSEVAEVRKVGSVVRDRETGEAVGMILQVQRSLPVIVLVPSIHAPVVEEVRNAGAHLVIEKPFDRRAILDLVERAIERTALLRKIDYLRTHAPRQADRTPVPSSSENRYFYREVVRRFSKAISQVFDYRKLLDLAVEAIVETFTASKAAILLIDPRNGRYVPMAASGYPRDVAALRSFEQVDELPIWLAKHNQILLAQGMSVELDFDLLEQIRSLGAEIVVGLLAKGKLIGIAAIGPRTTGKGYCDDDIELLSIFSSYLAMAIENALLSRDIVRSRVHNEKVLNCLRTGIVTIDVGGIVTVFNKAAEEILELKGEDIVGQKVERMGSAFADIMLRTLSGDSVYTRHEIISPLNKKPLGVSTSEMLDEEGEIDGAILAFADLSRIKVLEEKEKDFERVEFWSKVAGRLAHEVKNPLVPIKTFAQLLPQRYKDSEFREEFYRIVNGEIDRLTYIIGQLTKFADSSPPDLKPTDVHKVIESALAAAKTKLGAKGAKVVKAFSRDQLMSRADASLLGEAFANIIDNAADAIEQGGTITISTAMAQLPQGSNGSVAILFKDNGKGMPEDELKDIFSPFSTSKTHGMGLGLAIARRIVMDHHGAI
ncbi:MAG: ATP-binding protein, partial [Candidatus Aureabacteria bacterium]|nr:ATP-binding protein [Candidatus Auribacterota bacterium]